MMNVYDFHARTYAPDLCRFWQPDPQAHDYHWLSPYAYCGGDPVNFIDPDGEKIYYVDMTGRPMPPEDISDKISNRSEYEAGLEGLDRVVILDNDGKIFSESDTFDEGTIQLHDNSLSELKGKDITLWEITGDKASKSIFEFFAKYITRLNGIEYGHITRGSGKKDNINAVFTGHEVKKLSSFTDVLNYQRNAKAIFREIIHSHRHSAEPSIADINSRNQVIKIFNNKKRRIPSFKIYVSDIPMYVNYTNINLK